MPKNKSTPEPMDPKQQNNKIQKYDKKIALTVTSHRTRSINRRKDVTLEQNYRISQKKKRSIHQERVK